MTFRVFSTSKSDKRGVVKSTVATFETQAEAERFRSQELRGFPDPTGIEEIKKDPGDQVIKSKEQLNREEEARRRKQDIKLATQAATKASGGQQVSGAERKSFQRITGESLSSALTRAEQQQAQKQQNLPFLVTPASSTLKDIIAENKTAKLKSRSPPKDPDLTPSQESSLTQARGFEREGKLGIGSSIREQAGLESRAEEQEREKLKKLFKEQPTSLGPAQAALQVREEKIQTQALAKGRIESAPTSSKLSDKLIQSAQKAEFDTLKETNVGKKLLGSGKAFGFQVAGRVTGIAGETKDFLLRKPTKVREDVVGLFAGGAKKSVDIVTTPGGLSSTKKQAEQSAAQFGTALKDRPATTTADIALITGGPTVVGKAVQSVTRGAKALKGTNIKFDVVGSQSTLTGKVKKGSFIKGQPVEGRFLLKDADTNLGTSRLASGDTEVFTKTLGDLQRTKVKVGGQLVKETVGKAPKDVVSPAITGKKQTGQIVAEITTPSGGQALSKELIKQTAKGSKASTSLLKKKDVSLQLEQVTKVEKQTTASGRVISDITLQKDPKTGLIGSTKRITDVQRPQFTFEKTKKLKDTTFKEVDAFGSKGPTVRQLKVAEPRIVQAGGIQKTTTGGELIFKESFKSPLKGIENIKTSVKKGINKLPISFGPGTKGGKPLPRQPGLKVKLGKQPEPLGFVPPPKNPKLKPPPPKAPKFVQKQPIDIRFGAPTKTKQTQSVTAALKLKQTPPPPKVKIPRTKTPKLPKKVGAPTAGIRQLEKSIVRQAGRTGAQVGRVVGGAVSGGVAVQQGSKVFTKLPITTQPSSSKVFTKLPISIPQTSPIQQNRPFTKLPIAVGTSPVSARPVITPPRSPVTSPRVSPITSPPIPRSPVRSGPAITPIGQPITSPIRIREPIISPITSPKTRPIPVLTPRSPVSTRPIQPQIPIQSPRSGIIFEPIQSVIPIQQPRAGLTSPSPGTPFITSPIFGGGPPPFTPVPPPTVPGFPGTFPRLGGGGGGGGGRGRKGKGKKRGFKGTRSLSVILGGKGQKLTKKQREGKEFINPFQLREF